jgi:outer membrane protein
MRHLFLAVLFTAGTAAAQQPEPPQKLSRAEAIAYGLQRSPIVRSSLAEVAAARAATGAARGRTGIQISASGFASTGNMPGILQSPMGIEPQSLVLSPDGEFFDLNLMLMAPLYTGGYLPALVAAAVAREQAAIAEASGVRAEVALRIRETYARVQLTAELVKAQRARLAAAEAMVRNARAQLEAGKGIEAWVRRAEAELEEAKRDLAMVENEREKLILDLLAEMGSPLEATVDLVDTLALELPQTTLTSRIEAAKNTRGELLAARRREESATRQVAAAEGALRPQVYGFAMGDAFSPRDMGRNSGYTVGLAVSLPLADGGMRRSEIAAARAMKERARADVARWELQVEKEVRQAWLDLDTSQKNVGSAEAAAVAAQSAYEVIAVRVEAGKGILVEELDALAALTRAKANMAQALYEREIALARLDRAIGLAGPESVRSSR